ncbi:choice-of-anchor A family protein [Teredinibacter franksiae]|uniref:choice-of-anchor A family protein n=1 Tax=Teredinibacter franksiae TaxID=2761453 RepID=UPI001627D58F|nr:choice-of-anchor A family protein [Teredinibacter franksiae]
MYRNAFRALVMAATVFAGTQAAAMPLSEYNLIVLNDFDGTVHVQGKTLIGGDMTAPDSVLSADAELLFSNSVSVGGNIYGHNIQVQNGNVVYGGDNTDESNISVHNGTIYQDLSLSIAAVESELESYSAGYAGLSANGFVAGDMNGRRFTYTGTESVAVFDIDASLFQNSYGFGFDLGSAETAIINVTGNAATIHGGMNFLGNIGELYDNILWNFHEATSITLNNKFVGSVLATQADVTNNGFDFDGALAARNYNTNATNELHSFNFQPPATEVPEPASGVLMLMSLGLLALARNRKRGSVNL